MRQDMNEVKRPTYQKLKRTLVVDLNEALGLVTSCCGRKTT